MVTESQKLENTVLPFTQINGDITKNCERILFGVAHINGMMMQSMLRYNMGAAGFLHHRLQEDMKAA